MWVLTDIAIGDLQPQGSTSPQRALRLVAAEETEGQPQLDWGRSPGRSDAARRALHPDRVRSQCRGYLDVLSGQHPAVVERGRKVLPGIAPVSGNLAGNKGSATRLVDRPLRLELGPLSSRRGDTQTTYDGRILAPPHGMPNFGDKPAEQNCRQQRFGIKGQRLQVLKDADNGILRSVRWSDVPPGGWLECATTASAAMAARTQDEGTGDWFSGGRPYATD